ncbi:MAG: tetratricopeptide repeat protein [Bacteroidetes bacterium]|nr:tetratricopeptide repeat protein [Bacteroidota bacterium]
MKKYLVLFFILFNNPLLTNAIGNQNIDSLKTIINFLKEDTNKINTYINIAKIYENNENYDSCIIYIDNAIELSKKISKNIFLAKAFDFKGKTYRNSGSYDKSLDFHIQALEIAKQTRNKHLTATILNHIGVTYRRLTEDNKALIYHFRALKLAEEINDKKNLAIANNSIGIVYTYQGSYDDALIYFKKALNIEKKNNLGIAINLNSIAWVYELKKDYRNAIKYYKQSLEVNKRIKNKKGIAICNIDIGNVYRKIGAYKQSVEYYNKALEINKSIGDKRHIARSRIYLGEVYADIGNYKKSLTQLQIGLNYAKQSNSKRLVMSGYKNLAIVYEKLEFYNNALRCYKNSTIYKDSIFNEDKASQIVKMRTIYETEKKVKKIERQKKELSQKEEKIKQKNTQRNVSIIAVIMLLITLIAIFKNSREKQKINIILREQKDEIINQADKLNKTNKELIRTTKLKDLSFARISHEIRNPVNVIVGFADLLENIESDDKANSYIENIKISCKSLLVTINDLLDFSKIDAGKLKIEKIDFNLLKLLSNFQNTMSLTAEQKNIKFSVKNDPLLPKYLIGDPSRLNQILTNLVLNSVKFSYENSEIKIFTTVIKQNKNEAKIQFTISDKGIGIPQNKLDFIFKDYAQAKDETSRKYGGAGLGLSIVKNLIDLQNGNIKVKSEEGKGTDFIFCINYKKADYKKESEDKKSKAFEQNKNIKKLKVLLVDDNPINRALAIDTIKYFNKSIKIDEAENGKIAIEMLSKNDYNLLLLDIIMPVTDGFEATQIIRNNLPEPKKSIPILGMTGNAKKEEKDKCLAIGMNEYITKPFNPEDLFRKIKLLSKQNL